MTLYHKIECVACKVISVMTLTVGVLWTPWHLSQVLSVNVFNVAALVVMSVVIVTVGWFTLIRTNNPADRFNPLSINRQWRSIHPGPVLEQPLDQPTQQDKAEVTQKRRVRRITRVLSDN
jgi:hypothetical protein